MSAIVKLVQGSPAWHEHRARHRNASETPAVLGVSPWLTPYQLWELRTGRRQPEVNAPMAHGTTHEPQARAAYEQITENVMQPLVLVDGEYSASLDGLTFDGSLIVELKAPYKGKASRLWQAASQGQVPVNYGWQIEHQLMVSHAALAHLYVYDAESDNGILLEVAPKPERWAQINEAWNGFMQCIATDTPPALTDRDKLVRSDEPWAAAAGAYVQLKQEADAVAERLNAAKETLTSLASHPSESGHGVTVTRFWKQGSVDFKRVPELQAVDLEHFRGPMRQEVRISLTK